MYIDADYRILIWYCSDEEKRKKCVKQAREILKSNPRTKDACFYLLLGDKTFYRFQGYEISIT